MTHKLDIAHHAVERYIARVDKWATREQAMAAIREAWRGARRLHRHSGDRVLYEANGGAFKLSVAERPHGRMAILSVLPGNEDEDPTEEILPAPLPSRPVVVEVPPPKWKYQSKHHEPTKPLPSDEFRPPSSIEEAHERRAGCIARVNAILLQLRSLPKGHDLRRQLSIDQQREQLELSRLKDYTRNDNVSAAYELRMSQLHAAWRLLLECREHVPDHMVRTIDQEIPPEWDPNKPEDSEID